MIYKNKVIENGRTLNSCCCCCCCCCCCKNQETYNKAVHNYPHALELIFECYKTKQFVIEPLILILLQLNMFLNVIRLNKCVIKQFIDAVLYLPLLLINIKHKKM